MGELGAFLRLDRADPLEPRRSRRAGRRRARVRPPAAAPRAPQARVRAAWSTAYRFCHQRLPARESDPGLERPRLRDRWRRRSTSCIAPTTSPSSPVGSARRRARPRACSRFARVTRSRSSRSRSRSSIAPGTKGGSCRARRRVARGRTVAVVGSGPAGLACAQQLARAGHTGHRGRARTRRPAASSGSGCPSSRSRSG